MFVETTAIGLFGLVMALAGLLIGVIGTVLLGFYKKGVKQETKKTDHT